MRRVSQLGIMTALAVSLCFLGFQSDSDAQGSLRIGGSNSNFGSRVLRGGFTPDPSTVAITSGGRLNASGMGLGAGCRGFVTRRPDFILNYRNARGFLRLFFNAGGDTTLVINDANGRWHCNDDTGGLNPQVDINNPSSGQYDIWVGSYRAGENIRGTLSITELRSVSVNWNSGGGGGGGGGGSLQIGGNNSNFGSVTLRGGFMPDPRMVAITSGGNLNAANMGLGAGCRGNVTRRPDYIVNYRNAASFLRFFVRSGGDTTLVINDANGRWHCNDDSNGLNPMVSINGPPSGQYDIWVGSYRAGENLSSRLFITELRNQSP